MKTFTVEWTYRKCMLLKLFKYKSASSNLSFQTAIGYRYRSRSGALIWTNTPEFIHTYSAVCNKCLQDWTLHCTATVHERNAYNFSIIIIITVYFISTKPLLIDFRNDSFLDIQNVNTWRLTQMSLSRVIIILFLQMALLSCIHIPFVHQNLLFNAVSFPEMSLSKSWSHRVLYM